MKKRITIISISVLALLLLSFIISVPLVNNYSAGCVEDELLNIQIPSDTVLVESLSRAGKLVGNGNGMQYFGALLVKSELSPQELADYYKNHNESITVKKQESESIDFLEHNTLSFESDIADSDGYYIVYMFGGGISPFSHLDLRGH